jgi:hypothetical protein
MPALRAADLKLTADQTSRIASIFSIEPAALRRMTFAKVSRSSHRLY